eukprot:782293-Pelagomonas_calceolata.AAC.3
MCSCHELTYGAAAACYPLMSQRFNARRAINLCVGFRSYAQLGDDLDALAANARPEHFSAGGCAAQAKHIRPATAVTASILGEPRRASSSSSEGTARLQMDQQQECLTLMVRSAKSFDEPLLVHRLDPPA